MFRKVWPLGALALCLLAGSSGWAASKPHVVGLGSVRRVPYSALGDPAGAKADEKQLAVRPLVVDGKVKEWTTGEVHDVTDRSFAVRRAMRINDALPADKAEHWVWQRGPWLLIDRIAGKTTALHLPDYDPAVSEVVWFRDYAAYCGVNAGGKSLYAMVAQIAVRKPVLARKLGSWEAGSHEAAACGRTEWQRDPLRVTFAPTGAAATSFDLVGSSAVLVEEGDDSNAEN